MKKKTNSTDGRASVVGRAETATPTDLVDPPDRNDQISVIWLDKTGQVNVLFLFK